MIRFSEPAEDAPLDVHSFRALERLAVHVARTEADLGSRVSRPGQVHALNLFQYRGSRDVWAMRRSA